MQFEIRMVLRASRTAIGYCLHRRIFSYLDSTINVNRKIFFDRSGFDVVRYELMVNGVDEAQPRPSPVSVDFK